MTNKLLCTIFLSFLFSSANCQLKMGPREVLDKTAETFVAQDGIKADFKADYYTSGEIDASAQGSICIQGKKFYITTSDLITWFNGETQWSYMVENDEVNISTPSTEELQAMNPYFFLNLYKDGYKYKMKETNLRGKDCYEITLTAKEKNKSPHDIILNINQVDFTPMCIRIRMKKKNKWARISIYNYEGGISFLDDKFVFKQEEYPDVEVIDLR